jgi:hypothetical protein
MAADQKIPEPSDVFINSVRHSGSLVINCELCGRVHFGDGSGDYDPGELEDLQIKATAEPEKYIQHFDDDMVSWGMMDGKQAVIGCPCNKLTLYERFIWNHRNVIAKYLRDRVRQMIEDARHEVINLKLPDDFPEGEFLKLESELDRKRNFNLD